MTVTQIIFNVVLILVFVSLGYLLIRKLKQKKEENEDIEKLLEDLAAEDNAAESSEVEEAPSSLEPETGTQTKEPQPEVSEKPEEITSRVKIKDLELSKDDVKLHEKAKRKARVIVREIEMYNKEKAKMGLKEGNLYKYLKEEIETGRKTYQNAVSKHIFETTKYYDESLLNILASGDKNILGMDI